MSALDADADHRGDALDAVDGLEQRRQKCLDRPGVGGQGGWDLEQVPFSQLSDEFMAGYHARKLECGLHDGTRAVLAGLQARGIPQSVISAAEERMVHDLLRHYQIENYFIAARGLDNHHAAGKTAIGVQWVGELGLDPGTILMVGDTVHDYEVAQAMGTDCVLVASGHHRPWSGEQFVFECLVVGDDAAGATARSGGLPSCAGHRSLSTRHPSGSGRRGSDPHRTA